MAKSDKSNADKSAFRSDKPGKQQGEGGGNAGGAEQGGSVHAESDGRRLNTSVDEDARKKVAEALTKAVADSYTLYSKTLGVHWNVQGPNFYGLHKLTDAQYNELHEAADAMAERIRALGQFAPTGNDAFRAATVIKNDAPHGTTEEMIRQLVADNELAARRMSEFAELAEEHGDMYTNDMLIARVGVHEENAWMLRASL